MQSYPYMKKRYHEQIKKYIIHVDNDRYYNHTNVNAHHIPALWNNLEYFLGRFKGK